MILVPQASHARREDDPRRHSRHFSHTNCGTQITVSTIITNEITFTSPYQPNTTPAASVSSTAPTNQAVIVTHPNPAASSPALPRRCFPPYAVHSKLARNSASNPPPAAGTRQP